MPRPTHVQQRQKERPWGEKYNRNKENDDQGVGMRQEYANKSEGHGKASGLEEDIQVKKKTDRVTPAGKRGRVT